MDAKIIIFMFSVFKVLQCIAEDERRTGGRTSLYPTVFGGEKSINEYPMVEQYLLLNILFFNSKSAKNRLLKTSVANNCLTLLTN